MKQRLSAILSKKMSLHLMWAIALGLFAVKLFLCSFQLMYASPELSPIDDTLMVNLAKSISDGNWLGEYNWLTLGKHSFFALWLSVINTLGLNFLMAGQLLFGLACFTLLCALKPMFKTNWARLFVFAIVLFTPASWAEYSLRVYRDNIYPALVLFALSGILGAFVRFKEPVLNSLGYHAIAGAALCAAWLCHEDNALLLPFIICAFIAYALFLFLSKDITKRLSRLAVCLVPIMIFAGGISAWCGMNKQYYGRFIVSDFTSSEFNDAMGALSRAYPSRQKAYNLVPKETRLALYEVSPTLKTIEPYLETDEIYNGYGSVQDKEILSGGLHWAIRKAADKAGYYKTAALAQSFYTAVAQEVNQACDDGLLPSSRKISGVFAPYKNEYFIPTVKNFFEELKVMLFFEQTKPTADFSIARPDQSEDWESFMHCTSTKSAIAGTDKPYFSSLSKLMYFKLNFFTWVQRILLFPMLIISAIWCFKYTKRFIKNRKKELPFDLLGTILMLGFFLTGLLRVAAMAYFMAVIFSVGAYLMYLSAACAIMLAFLAYCTAKAAEDFALTPP
ncbi:MAG: hypothetical protein RR576_10105 [Oscillospiraceae bacterium]